MPLIAWCVFHMEIIYELSREIHNEIQASYSCIYCNIIMVPQSISIHTHGSYLCICPWFGTVQVDFPHTSLQWHSGNHTIVPVCVKQPDESGQQPWWRHQMEKNGRYWPFVRGIHRSLVDFPHKGQWRGVWCFFLGGGGAEQMVEQTIEMPSRSLASL